MIGDGLPTFEEVRTYIGVPDDVLPDADLERMWGAALANQMKACVTPLDADGEQGDPEDPEIAAVWPAPLVEALLRRVQRSVAAQNLPLGFLDTASEFGPARIPMWDAVIEEREGPYRVVVTA